MSSPNDLRLLAKKARKLGLANGLALPERAGLGTPGLEFAPPEAARNAESAVLKKAGNDDLADFSAREVQMLEAIVEREGRPVSFVRKGRFEDLPDPWSNFNGGAARQTIERAIPAVGRVELIAPGGPGPVHLGSGFIVGQRLMMTNRHVAEVFVRGVGRGIGTLSFVPGRNGAFDFGREVDDDPADVSKTLRVTGVTMIHPYWDMALLSLESMPAGIVPLSLSTSSPEDLVDAPIATIGYPARGHDRRPEAVELEEIHFGGTFGVKRLAPGEIDGSESTLSFEHMVRAMRHDCSTLAGNSGSMILQVSTGQVVGLHFKGATLRANYSVPAYELARDARVVDAGLNFTGNIASTGEWDQWWRDAGEGEALGVKPPPTVVAPGGIGPRAPEPESEEPIAVAPAAVAVSGQAMTFTVPITIRVSVGEAGASVSSTAPSGETAGLEAMKVPVMYDGLEYREGYNPDFLNLPGGATVPLPKLTAEGKEAVAYMADGKAELKYHHFSIFMHAKRRLALFTAANVDWREAKRLVDGKDPTRAQLTGLGKNDIEQWVPDERLPAEVQLPDVFFTKDRKAFDKGHLVRRDDVAWGEDFENMQIANGDTYHTTNCSPQVKGYNQGQHGVFNWGDLEKMVEDETRSERVMVFSGPVLGKQDRIFVGRDDSGMVKVKIPREYWKIIVARTPEGAKAYGFMPKQDLSKVDFGAVEFAVPEEWKEHQKSIADIEAKLSGLLDLSWFKERDTYQGGGNEGAARQAALVPAGPRRAPAGDLRHLLDLDNSPQVPADGAAI